MICLTKSPDPFDLFEGREVSPMQPNPYESPESHTTPDVRPSWHRVYLIAMSVTATCGVFATVFYVAGLGLYLFVFGDTSSTFGHYAMAIAIVPTLGAGGWLLTCAMRRRHVPIVITLIVTMPALYWLVSGAIRYGL